MAENNKKYVSPSKLSVFLDNLKNIFSPLGHKHTLAEIENFVVDSELSSTSTNPVQNATLDAEFEAIEKSFEALELAIDGKSNSDHNHDNKYDALGSAETALDTSKEYTDNKVASMVFVGTYAEYQTAYASGQIPINTFVILTDDGSGSGSSGGDSTSTSTSSLLGTGALGYMVLG